MMFLNIEAQKKAAAEAALAYVRPGMRLGLGTGSTVRYFLESLAPLIADGLAVCCVPTSQETARKAESLKIPLSSLDELQGLDLTIDGADECDEELNLIKGGGGALLREKIVGAASTKMIVIADRSKYVKKLGKFPLPIEIIPFGMRVTLHKIGQLLNTIPQLRQRSGENYVTDNHNFICDCALGEIADPHKIACSLSMIPGVVEHGLFINMASLILVGGPDGVKEIRAKPGPHTQSTLP